MKGLTPTASKGRQGGFSMIELLIAAVILAVGILGLTSLQVMAVKTNTGTRALNTAVDIGNQILDNAATESRLSWNNLLAASPQTLPSAVYLNPTTGARTEFYDQSGLLLGNGTTAPTGTVFTVVTTSTAGIAMGSTDGGRTTTVQVVVRFNDTPTHQRTVTLSRSVKSA